MIAGREEEQRLLARLLDENSPQFLAIYGRRRVAKTYLVRKFFAQRKVPILEVVGTKGRPKEVQIDKCLE